MFGYKLDETTPCYPVYRSPSGETSRPQSKGIRFALKVRELCNKSLLNGLEDEVNGPVRDKLEIAKWVTVIEYLKRRDRRKVNLSHGPKEWSFSKGCSVLKGGATSISVWTLPGTLYRLGFQH